MLKTQNIFLLLAILCSLLLCFFSPVYFTSAEDAGHYFNMHLFSIDAMSYQADGRLVADETFVYEAETESGSTERIEGAHIMSIWALPILAIVMALLSFADIILGMTATKVRQLLLQANLNIVTLICALGYYAMLALYTFFATARFDLDWHMSWPAAMPIVIFILIMMSMRAISKSAKKVARDLSGSIR